MGVNGDQREAELNILASKVVGELVTLDLTDCCTDTADYQRAWQVVRDALEVFGQPLTCGFCHLPYRQGWAHTPEYCWDTLVMKAEVSKPVADPYPYPSLPDPILQGSGGPGVCKG